VSRVAKEEYDHSPVAVGVEEMVMAPIRKRYILDKRGRRVAVVLPVRTFERIEEILEDYLFGQALEEVKHEKPMTLKQAKKYYAKLKKR